jgi:hypothetical protein
MRLRSLLLLIFCLSWVISCRCGSIPPEKGESHFSAQIYTDKIECLGSINIKGFLVKVEGRIQDNQLKGASRVCLIVIPDGVNIKDAGQELSELNQEPSEQGAGIKLAKSKGFAYYGSSIAASYFGGLMHTAYVPHLDRTQQYKAYLGATSQESAQWVVYSEKGIDIQVPITGPAASQEVAMIKPEAKRNPTKIPSPMKFKWEGEVKNKVAGFDGGFLLIKQGSSIKQPSDVLAILIRQKKALSPGKMLEKVAGYEGVLVSTAVTPVDFKTKHGAAESITSEGEDSVNDKALEPGATYQVYCYIVDDGHNYMISKQELVNIPKVNAELEMLEVSNAHLVGNMTTEVVDKFKLNLKGKILKQEGTVAPDFGFLFVKGAAIDQVAAIAQATTLSDHISVGNFNKNAGGGDMIYVASQPGPAAAGDPGGEQEFKNIEDVPKDFELGQVYTVYCWLKDGGDVFVSANSVELKIPKVVGHIIDDSVDSGNDIDKDDAFTMDMSSQVDSQTYFNEGNQAVWGYFFVKDGVAVDYPGDFERILKNAQNLEEDQKRAIEINAQGGKETVPGANLDGRIRLLPPGKDKVFLRTRIGTHVPYYGLTCKEHDPFVENSQYQVYFWVRDGNAIFYSNVANKLLKTYKDIKKDDAPQIVLYTGNPDYQEYHVYLKVKNQIYGVKAGGEKVLLNKTADKDLLKEVLREMIQMAAPKKTKKMDDIITSLALQP